MSESNQNNIIAHREFNIKVEKDEYNLRIEVDQDYIYFILSKLNEPLEYTYKNKMDLLTIVNKLELNSSKYSNLELILNIFDTIYEKNKINIDIKDDNSCNILVKLVNIFEQEVEKEIKLYKEYMNNNDKFNILFSKIQLLNYSNFSSEDNSNIEKNINKFNKKEEEIKDILNQKDSILKEINEKLLKHENEIKKLSEENLNEIINKKFGEIENKLINNLNEKYDIIKNKLIEDINKQNKIIEKLKDNNGNKKIKEMEEKYNKLIDNLDFMKEMEKNKEKGIITEGEIKNNELLYQYNNINNIKKDNELIKGEIKEINNKINNNDKEIKNIENILKEKEVIINNLQEK